MPRRVTCAVLLAGVVLAACAPGEGSRPSLADDVSIPDGAAAATTTAPAGGAVPTTSAPATTSAPVPPGVVPPGPLVLGFAGDTQFTRPITDPFGGVADLVTSPQLMMVNLETTIAEEGIGTPPVDKDFLFRSPPASAATLRDGGIDVVGLANNHIWDFGDSATIRTVELLDEAGVGRVGAAPEPAAAYDPLIRQAAGRTVAVLSFTRVPCSWAGAGGSAARPLIAWACDPFLERTDAAVAAAVGVADVVVVLLHAGEELALCPEPDLRAVVERWVAGGVDVVAVSHPHVLRGAERMGDAVVLWSTGNFVFPNRGGETGRSAVFHVLVDGPVGDDRTLDVIAHPVLLPGGRPQVADEATAARILADLGDRSVGWGFDDSRRLVPDPAPSVCDGGAAPVATDVAPRTTTTTTTVGGPGSAPGG